MNTLLHWLTSPEWALVVKALLHSLWQGALIAVALALGLRRIANPAARYRLALTGLGAVLAATVITWGALNALKAPAPAFTPAPEATIATPPPAGPVEKIVVAANWTPAQPHTQWTAWLALVWLIGASAMLGRASLKVAGAEQLRRSCQPLNDPRITALVTEARRAVKLTRQVRVAVTQQLTSPAVVGVLMPTLILPLSLITTLSPEQIRFVLLHELAHIRRGDYLANLFQLFAEALLFFNPAVWWLSHQIRREREACCDALAIELSGAPADYARTLVSVAETMLNPSPAAAPAFGNDREPSSLSDRVQRVLVPGYRPSLRLTWRAMLAALVLGGVLLGMLAVGTRTTVGAILSPNETGSTSNSPTAPSQLVLEGNVPVDVANVVEVRSDGSYWMGADQVTLLEVRTRASALKQSTQPGAILLISAGPEAPDDALIQLGRMRDEIGVAPDVEQGSSFGNSTNEFLTRVFSVDGSAFLAAVRRQLEKPSGYPAGQLLTKLWADKNLHPRQWTFKADEGRLLMRATREDLAIVEQFIHGMVSPAADTHQSAPKPPATSNVPSTQAVQVSAGRKQIVSKLESIRFDEVMFDHLPLHEVTRILSKESKRRDPDKGGVNFIISPSPTTVAQIDPATGLPTAPAAASGVELSTVPITILPAMQKVTLREVLDAIVKASPQPIAYSVEDYGIMIKPANTNAAHLHTRSFKVDTNALLRAMGEVGPVGTPNTAAALREFVANCGVDLKAPGKTMFYKDRTGTFIVRATSPELDTIEQAVRELNEKPAAIPPEQPRSTPHDGSGTNLHTRVFRVATNEFAQALALIGPLAGTNAAVREQAAVRKFVTQAGVDLQPPKTVFYNNRQGTLIVRATLADLDNIEQAITELGARPPQVNIRAKFVEVPMDSTAGKLLGNLLPASSNMISGGIASQASINGYTGILTASQTKALYQAFEAAEGVEFLSMPDVTTLSGRPAQLQVVAIHNIITGETNFVANGVRTFVSQTTPMLSGPTLDVIPNVLADGLTIQMTAIPSVTEFLGYDDPGLSVTVPRPIPHFRVRQVTTTGATVLDGQTIVIAGFVSQSVWPRPGGIESRQASPKLDTKRLFFFITPTIIDPAGNRVHTDEEMEKISAAISKLAPPK